MSKQANQKIMLTGAGGFIGRVLVAALNKLNYELRTVMHSDANNGDIVIGDIGPNTDWSTALASMDCVVHLAARVHVMHDAAADPIAEFRRVNVEGTLNLARQATATGVKRFIFLSSIKVNGERTVPGTPFVASDPASPQDAYAKSKWEAEQGLLKLASETGMEIVIIRPPLVYGPGVKANFLSMMQYLYKGVPLPFGAIHNQRSLVALDNLVDLIIACLEHPAAANQVFLVSDGEDLSTTELLRRTAIALGKPARLVPVPQWLLESGLKVLGKKELAQRLCGSLQVDISKTRDMLGWTPQVSVDEGLRRTTKAFLETTQQPLVRRRS